MTKYLTLLLLTLCISCKVSDSIIEEHVMIDVYSYEYEGKKDGAAMPKIKRGSELKQYERRFDYLLMNVPAIHTLEKRQEMIEIFNTYPDKKKMRTLYLEKLSGDKKLVAYFEETVAPFNNPGNEISKTYTEKEMMEVASKFFYCDELLEDTIVQAHVCIGLNGVKEAIWEKDYTLLAAFCFEAIFADFDNDPSEIWESFVAKKSEASEKYLPGITSLDQYLLDVRLDLFERMEADEILEKKLLSYYELNKSNLAFRITN